MRVVTGSQMRSIEEAAVEQGLSIPVLIERAGRAVDSAVRSLSPAGRALVLAGPGNNGADGITAARRMHARGESVCVYGFRRRPPPEYVGPFVATEGDETGERLRLELARAEVVVDALLGTGQSRPAEGTLARILEIVSEAATTSRHHLAADVPTGVDADTGRLVGSAFRADLTVCMGFPKRGVITYPGAEYAGRLLVARLGLAETPVQQDDVHMHGDGYIASLLPRRSSDGNKGSSGRLLFAGGSADFVGAPILAGLAAYRAGAGLVELAIPKSARDAMSAHALEPIYRLLSEEDGHIASAAAPSVADASARARAVVVGPGMGLSAGTIDFVRSVLPALRDAGARPTVIDADGLNALGRIDRWWDTALPRILTPHPGEMSRLTGKSVAEIQSDRIGVAQEYASRWDSVVVLKGAGTVIAEPGGRVTINTTGGPNLATAGTGDVLSGIIGGLLAQGCPLEQAAVAGVYIHGRAGDIVRHRRGDVGSVAGDLLDAITAARALLTSGESGNT